MGRVVDVLATLLCIGAGVYLLQYNSSGDQTSWFEIIGHGMGIYFIGKGLFIARATHLQARAADALDQIAYRSDESSEPEP
jgi:hypothetical protein